MENVDDWSLFLDLFGFFGFLGILVPMSDVNLVLLAHNVRSLWNVGSLFRSADAFGVSHIHLTGYTAAPPRREIAKTALGAEEWIPWSKDTDPVPVVERRRKEGYRIVALEVGERSMPIAAINVPGPLCLIVGHEILGVPKVLMDLSDATVAIPMVGRKHSLNVAVAAGIAMYHLRTCENLLGAIRNASSR